MQKMDSKTAEVLKTLGLPCTPEGLAKFAEYAKAAKQDLNAAIKASKQDARTMVHDKLDTRIAGMGKRISRLVKELETLETIEARYSGWCARVDKDGATKEEKDAVLAEVEIEFDTVSDARKARKAAEAQAKAQRAAKNAVRRAQRAEEDKARKEKASKARAERDARNAEKAAEKAAREAKRANDLAQAV